MAKLAMPFDNPTTYKDRPHSGVDFGQPLGKQIKASGDGVVTFVGWLNDNAGWSTIVDYTNTPPILYCHQPNMPGIKVGNKTALGSAIGIVGSSGRSTGPHLHMEVMSGVGAHTYEGVWLYFDKDEVVGQGSTAGTVIGEEMIVWIRGKVGKREAGIWLLQGNKATMLSKAVAQPGMVQFGDENTIAAIAKKFKGLPN